MDIGLVDLCKTINKNLESIIEAMAKENELLKTPRRQGRSANIGLGTVVNLIWNSVNSNSITGESTKFETMVKRHFNEYLSDARKQDRMNKDVSKILFKSRSAVAVLSETQKDMLKVVNGLVPSWNFQPSKS